VLRTLHGIGYAFRAPEAPDSPDAALEAAVPNGWLVGDVAEIALAAGDNVLGREGIGVILLKSSTVSRRHACIRIEAGGTDRSAVSALGANGQTIDCNRRCVVVLVQHDAVKST
jgi:hypothetical protein